MLVLIAESKTMTPCDGIVSPDELAIHTPVFIADAERIMESLRGFSPDQLANAVKISMPMARKLQQMIYEFPNRLAGSKAIDAFTGVVFKSFGYSTLTPEERERTSRNVRIISSLYGWLRPDDVVKAYRFDFTTRLAPEDTTFTAYWRPKVTAALAAELSDDAHEDILNLLPGDAARCIDWNRLPQSVRVWRADFREFAAGGEIWRGDFSEDVACGDMRPPNAGRLKTLRGRLLNQIIRNHIHTVAGLLSLEGPGYVSESAPDKDGNILFYTVND